jgi:hypothetical protein
MILSAVYQQEFQEVLAQRHLSGEVRSSKNNHIEVHLVTTPLPSAYTFLLTFIFLIASHSFCSHLLLDALNTLTRCSAFEATVATFENRSRSAQSNAARCAKYGRNKIFGCRRDNISQARTLTLAESDTMTSGTLFTPRNNPSSAVNLPSFRDLQHNALPITRD